MDKKRSIKNVTFLENKLDFFIANSIIKEKNLEKKYGED